MEHMYVLIFAVIALLALAAYVCEKNAHIKDNTSWSKENWSLGKQLRDERKHSDMLQKENAKLEERLKSLSSGYEAPTAEVVEE